MAKQGRPISVSVPILDRLLLALGIITKTQKPKKDFGTDLLTEILGRLPVKTLLRFRCICKSWRAIIDEPGFTFIHLTLFNKNQDATRLLTMETKASDFTLNVEQMNNPRKPTEVIVSLNGTPYVTVMGSGNGLLLMGTRSWQIALVNPSTKRALDLPRGPIAPLINEFNAAVGFDLWSNDVKVVVVPATRKASYSKVEAVAIYTLSRRSWRSRSVITNKNSSRSWYLKAHRPLFSGGALHWLARDTNNEDDHCPTHVALFHLETEKFYFIRLPNDDDDKLTGDKVRFPLLIGESMGVLDVTSQQLSIRVMQKHGKRLSWTEWFRSHIPMNTYTKFSSWCDCELLLVENFGKLLIKSDSVTSYDFESHRFQKIMAYNRYIGHHVESLAFHKGWPLPNDHI